MFLGGGTRLRQSVVNRRQRPIWSRWKGTSLARRNQMGGVCAAKYRCVGSLSQEYRHFVVSGFVWIRIVSIVCARSLVRGGLLGFHGMVIDLRCLW